MTKTKKKKVKTTQVYLTERLEFAIKSFMPASVKDLILCGAMMDVHIALSVFDDGLRVIAFDITRNPILRRDVINTFYIIVENLDFTTEPLPLISEDEVKFIHCTILDTNLSKMLINVYCDQNDSFFMDTIETVDVALLLELEQNDTAIETWVEDEDDFCDLVSDQFTGHTTIDKRLCGILLKNWISDLSEIVYYTTFVETTFLIDFAIEFF